MFQIKSISQTIYSYLGQTNKNMTKRYMQCCVDSQKITLRLMPTSVSFIKPLFHSMACSLAVKGSLPIPKR